MPKAVYHAYGYVKKAARWSISAAGRLPTPGRRTPSCGPPTRPSPGKLDAHFPLYVWQTGSGTQSQHERQRGARQPRHPAARRRARQPSSRCIPTTTSTWASPPTTRFPTAMHIATLPRSTATRCRRSDALADAIEAKADAWSDVVKIGRTHLQDADPDDGRPGMVGLGRADPRRPSTASSQRCDGAATSWPLGGTAVGTGLNAPDGLRREIAAKHRRTDRRTASSPRPTSSWRKARWTRWSRCSAALRGSAVALMKIANDMRWLASGPRAGLARTETARERARLLDHARQGQPHPAARPWS